MARVKCVMMQRDEDLLLEPWCLYYGYLFGFENLTIFDNGSVSEYVIELLKRFEGAGVTIFRKYKTITDWERKGDYFKLVIDAWDKGEEYDFAIPLDCDEFLSVFTAAGMSCQRSDIHGYLDSLIGRPEVLAIDTTNFNVPGHPGWFWPGSGSKRFFTAGSIATLDHGFHIATSKKSDDVFLTDLTHLHFHHKPYAVLIEHAKRKLSPYVDISDLQAILAYTGPNTHLVRHFRQTETEYLRQFDETITFGFCQLSAILSALGHHSEIFSIGEQSASMGTRQDVYIKLPNSPDQVPTIVLFDPDAYLTENLDVAAVYVSPVRHFIYSGFWEKRAISDKRNIAEIIPLSW